MAESITGMAKYGKYLAFLMQNRIVVTHDTGGHPNTWPKQAFADVGTNNEFVRQLAVDFMELIDATQIVGQQRDHLKGGVMALLVDGLLPAYDHLQAIRKSTSDIGIVKRNQQIEDFTGALWTAYKTLLPKTTDLLGYHIGFAFQGRTLFEKGAAAFKNAHPQYAEIPDYLGKQRGAWQNKLASFRNDFIEHRNLRREDFTEYYDPAVTTKLFELVSTLIGELLLIFIASKLMPQAGIERVIPEDRDPVHPRCFRWVLLEPATSEGWGGSES